MQQKKIYIVACNSRAAVYGIGTYKTQLIQILKNAGIEFGIIELFSTVETLTIEKKDGYELISVPFKSEIKNLEDTEYYSRNVAYLLRELIPDEKERKLIFHLNLMSDPTLALYLKRLFRCKVVLTIHYTNWSFDLLGNTKKLDAILYTKTRNLNAHERQIRGIFEKDIKMARLCDYIVYIAHHSSHILSKYIKKKNSSVIYNGLKDEYRPFTEYARCTTKSRYHIREDTKIVVFVGRLDEVKGGKYLIRSFRHVLSEHPNTLLMIVGDGDFSTLLKEAQDIWPKIVFTGRVDKKKLYELYRIADIGVACSLHEEFGYVAVEMMMHELPVIVSNTGGLAEIVEDGISGLKVPIVTRKGERQINTKMLSEKINQLLDDNELAERLGTGGRARYLNEFELSIFGKNMISIYNGNK